MKKILTITLVLGLFGNSAVLAIEDTGTNIWSGISNSLYQLEDSEREKLKEYKQLYDYYSSRKDQEKANLYLEKINKLLNNTRLW